MRDTTTALLSRMIIGTLPDGLRRPHIGPIVAIERERRIPLLDIGTAPQVAAAIAARRSATPGPVHA
ncbi:MAG: hypothetical protein JO057_30540 [Chloroflexi bacterium]|nr:hypothetical protein [Chloroflexota bacterium]